MLVCWFKLLFTTELIMKGKVRSLILMSLIVVPLLLYAFLKSCTTQVFKPVPKMYTLQGDKDTLFHQMPAFSGINASGKVVTQADFKDKVTIVYFFSPADDSLNKVLYTVLIGNLKNDFWELAKDVSYVRVLGVCTGDISQEKLAEYQKDIGISGDMWQCISADKANVWALAKKGFHLPELNGLDSLQQPFTAPTIAFVDKSGFVRGYYEATQLGIGGLRTLGEDLRALLMQEYKHDFKKK